MRKILFFIIVLLSFINVISQVTFNKVYHNKKERTGPFLTLINGESFFSSNTYDENQFGNCFLYKYGVNGSLKFRVPFQANFNNYPLINAGIKTNDNKLLLIGFTYVCDVLDTSQIRSYISKTDTNGTVIFTTKINRNFYNLYHYWDDFKTVLQNPDSTYSTFTDSVMFKFSQTGQLLLKKNLALDSISSCLLLQNGSILLSAKTGSQPSLINISQNGTVLNSQSFSTVLKKLSFYDGQKIMGLGTTGILYKIAPNFNALGNSSTVFSGSTDFVCENDSIYSITANNYSIADTAFTILSAATNTTQKVSQLSMYKNGRVIGILSQCATGASFNDGHTFSSLNVINKTSVNSFVPDIEVTSATVDSAYCLIDQLNTYQAYLRAKVKVKNKGGSLITDFTLNCYRYPDVACGSAFYEQQFLQPILPGDSVTVTTSFIHKRLYTSVTTASSIVVPYCIFSTMPNDANDRYIANDEFCDNFTLHVDKVFVKEFSNIENNLNIFPNPFNSNVNIECDYEIRSIEIINSSGLLLSREILNKNKITLNNSSLCSGLYFIKIETEKGTQIKKVVKQ